MSATVNAGNVVVVTGDDGSNRLRVVDGNSSYGVVFYDEADRVVLGGGKACLVKNPPLWAGF